MAQSAPPLTVLLAYAALADNAAAAQVAALDESLRVICCPYATSHEVRTLRDEQPSSTAIAAAMPALSAGQRSAFAAAHVALALDVPLELGVVAPNLRWVHNVGSGYGRYRSSGLREAGIVLTNSAGLSADGIAEFVLARLLEHWKRLPEIAAAQRARSWEFRFGARVAGKRVVIIGLGAIGSQVARLCRAVGMTVVGVARSAAAPAAERGVDELVAAGDLHGALGAADAAVLCATDTVENEKLFDAAAFAALPPRAIFVNVSRGRLVDEDALAAALAGGRLAAAAVDVSRVEPIPAESAVWDVPNLRISPHSSSTQDGYPQRVLDLFCDNLARFLAGHRLRNLVAL